jgi:hypothetical protein
LPLLLDTSSYHQKNPLAGPAQARRFSLTFGIGLGLRQSTEEMSHGTRERAGREATDYCHKDRRGPEEEVHRRPFASLRRFRSQYRMLLRNRPEPLAQQDRRDRLPWRARQIVDCTREISVISTVYSFSSHGVKAMMVKDTLDFPR